MTKVLPGAMIHVERLTNQHHVLAHISGKRRERRICINVSYRARVEMTSYDLDQALIVYRPGQPP